MPRMRTYKSWPWKGYLGKNVGELYETRMNLNHLFLDKYAHA